MARKDLLKGLLAPAADAAESPARLDTARPRITTGAIGAVSRSIADLKSRSVVELDPRMIDNAGMRDRLDPEDADLAGLIGSIRDHGQQVPVLVRVNPNYPERFQVVYGRRRVAALKALGQPVRALVRDLDDRALVLAQGQENTARKDLTFIEKANFARQMRDAGYDRKVICDALNMDKTLISRLLQIADAVPVALIEAIGSAPAIGRDRWAALAQALDGRDLCPAARGDTSDDRFAAVMAAAMPPAPAKRPAAAVPRKLTDAAGREIGQIARSGHRTTLVLDGRTAAGFDRWLAENIDEILRDWETRRGE